jgi:hypothetical protein
MNTFLSGPQEFDASQQPSALQITGDYPICQAYTPTTQPLTAVTGVPANSATINIAAFQIQYPFSTTGSSVGDLITYSLGAITPLLDGTQYFVYFNDPTYAGGAQTYIASLNNPDLTSGLYRQYLGNIVTPVHGGGGTGGSGGGGGIGGPPCFSGNTLVITKRGARPIQEIQKGDRVYSRTGWEQVERLLVHDYDGEMREMGSGELVTPTHRMRVATKNKALWLPAGEVFPVIVQFKGRVFNLRLLNQSDSDESCCYLLNNSWYAHNARKV